MVDRVSSSVSPKYLLMRTVINGNTLSQDSIRSNARMVQEYEKPKGYNPKGKSDFSASAYAVPQGNITRYHSLLSIQIIMANSHRHDWRSSDGSLR